MVQKLLLPTCSFPMELFTSLTGKSFTSFSHAFNAVQFVETNHAKHFKLYANKVFNSVLMPNSSSGSGMGGGASTTMSGGMSSTSTAKPTSSAAQVNAAAMQTGAIGMGALLGGAAMLLGNF